jgi:hypothetical protein
VTNPGIEPKTSATFLKSGEEEWKRREDERGVKRTNSAIPVNDV